MKNKWLFALVFLIVLLLVTPMSDYVFYNYALPLFVVALLFCCFVFIFKGTIKQKSIEKDLINKIKEYETIIKFKSRGEK